MRISGRGINLIKEWEKCRLVAYRDEHGIWTCGWGSTGSDIDEHTIWTQDEADARLAAFCAKYSDEINRLVTVPTTQNQFDALCSLAYNIGLGHFQASTLLKDLNEGDRHTAADQFLEWTKVAGHKSAGLEHRRAAERALFLSDVA